MLLYVLAHQMYMRRLSPYVCWRPFAIVLLRRHSPSCSANLACILPLRCPCSANLACIYFHARRISPAYFHARRSSPAYFHARRISPAYFHCNASQYFMLFPHVLLCLIKSNVYEATLARSSLGDYSPLSCFGDIRHGLRLQCIICCNVLWLKSSTLATDSEEIFMPVIQ